MNFYFVFCQDSLLLTQEGGIPLSDEPPVALESWQNLQKLPDLEGHPSLALQTPYPQAPTGLHFVGLREAFGILSPAFYQMAGKARELLYWESLTKYCGVCGAPMRRTSEISKKCPECGKEIWPSPSAAIIVAITRNGGREILLVQSKKFKRDYLGLVAGFVETGETLEACVRREVMEETNLRIKNLRYFASQAWPYPFGLMIGFTAEYESGDLKLQLTELNKGGWYSPENLPAIPGKVSLARQLIDHWLNSYHQSTTALSSQREEAGKSAIDPKACADKGKDSTIHERQVL